MKSLCLVVACCLWSISASAIGQWSPSELRLLRSLSLEQLQAAKADWRNPLLGHSTAEKLGRLLFADATLSANGKIACQSCHQPNSAWQDSKALAQGLRLLKRNTPSLIGVVHQQSWYWDGRKDSLWAQALEPLESRREMAGRRSDIALRLRAHDPYAQLYRKTFGEFPAALKQARPGASPRAGWLARWRWRRMSDAVQEAVTEVFVNAGQSLAAFEATLRHQSAPFDCFVASLPSEAPKLCKFSAAAERGLRLFISGRANCVSCHNGPLLTDAGFRNIGTGEQDSGRSMGVAALLVDEFNCDSRWSSAPTACGHLQRAQTVEVARLQTGAFRTPTLRNLRRTGPYMHDGRFNTLEEVMEHYTSGGHPSIGKSTLIDSIFLNEEQTDAVIKFLHTLTDEAFLQNPAYADPNG